MSVKISKDSLSPQQFQRLKEETCVVGNENKYGPAPIVRCLMETKGSVYVPLACLMPTSLAPASSPPKQSKEYPPTHITTTGTFKPHQISVYNEALHLLSQTNSVMLSLHTGFGKTFLAIMLASRLHLKTAILAHRLLLIDQWVKSIQDFTNATIQVVEAGSALSPNADFYIFNIAFVPKKWDPINKKWIPKKLDIYPDIGTLIVDEAHIACAAELSKALFYFQPKYTIGLTATPDREDGLGKMLDLYFGTNKIIRISQTPFTVYKVSTNIRPTVKKNSMGGKDWNSVIESLSANPQRNRIILDLVKNHPNNIILVLTKRVDQATLLQNELIKTGESVTILYRDLRDYNREARVLIATTHKAGTGFDDIRFNMLILAFSMKNVEQCAGRLRYTPGIDRLIFDLVDVDSNCNSHWLQRRGWYLSRNAEIKYLSMNGDPTFEEKPKRMAPKRVEKISE